MRCRCVVFYRVRRNPLIEKSGCAGGDDEQLLRSTIWIPGLVHAGLEEGRAFSRGAELSAAQHRATVFCPFRCLCGCCVLNSLSFLVITTSLVGLWKDHDLHHTKNKANLNYLIYDPLLVRLDFTITIYGVIKEFSLSFNIMSLNQKIK